MPYLVSYCGGVCHSLVPYCGSMCHVLCHIVVVVVCHVLCYIVVVCAMSCVI